MFHSCFERKNEKVLVFNIVNFPNFVVINYFSSICHFESAKCGKEVKKLTKFENFENEKRFFNEIKKHFL